MLGFWVLVVFAGAVHACIAAAGSARHDTGTLAVAAAADDGHDARHRACEAFCEAGDTLLTKLGAPDLAAALPSLLGRPLHAAWSPVTRAAAAVAPVVPAAIGPPVAILFLRLTI